MNRYNFKIEQINDILKLPISNEDKLLKLRDFAKDVEFQVSPAEGILRGMFEYCNDCEDWYLTKSFTREHKVVPGQVCIYEDPINSGGNTYADGNIYIGYKICPKGHKEEVSRSEAVKL